MTIIARIKCELAKRKLAADVEKRRNSFEVQDYRKRRAAALGAHRRSADRAGHEPSQSSLSRPFGGHPLRGRA